MKIRITMKDPDGVYDSVSDVVQTNSEREMVDMVLKQWFEYSEYLTVEVDTETNTIRVLEVER